MNDLYRDIANLSPDERKLFELLLKKEGLTDTPPLPQAADKTPPLSFVQERLWFIDQLIPYNAAYNVPRIVRITGALNTEALQRSFSEVVKRHQILRTTCTALNGKPVQQIHPAEPVNMPVIDLRHLSLVAALAEAHRRANRDVQHPIDLTRAPLLRVQVFWLADADFLLALTTHHYVADAPGMEILMTELAALYKAFTRAQPSPLADLPLQYADYARRQRRGAAETHLETQLDFWKNQLGDALDPLDLPTDRPRPAVFSYRGAKYWFDIPPAVAKKIKQFSRRQGVTIFMTMLAAFKTLLFRYTGQGKIVIGTIVSDRSYSGADMLIGSFTNNLALYTDLSGNPSFGELLQQIRKDAPQAYANQDIPFENLVEVLHIERDLSRPPLFQVMFSNHEGTVFKKIQFEDLTWEILPFDQRGARFDLSLEVQGWDTDQPRGYFEYSDDLFDEQTVARTADHLLTLIENAVADPHRPISQLDYLTAAEQRQLLVAWNDTAQPFSADATIHHLFEKQAERAPQTVAVEFGLDTLTYGELNQQANRLAHYLQVAGVEPETLVGLWVERSPEMVVGLLGILKAGAAYVPLDPAWPPDRLACILADTQLSVLMTQSHLLPQLPRHPNKVICLDTDWHKITHCSAQNPATDLSADNLAYVIHTSGSTGRPKGVQIPHRAAVNLLQAMAQTPGLTAQDRLLAVTTLSFDIAALEIFLPLSVGARLIIADRETAADGARLIKKLTEAETTVMQATPATWTMLLDSGWAGNDHLKILCGGETLSRNLADQLLPKCESLWNLYGPTETTIWSAVEQVTPGPNKPGIGRPIANTQIYLLDTAMQPVPVGVTGELYIGGVGLAQGYLNLPDLTAEKFIPNPFAAPSTSARLYRTGDLARRRPDGRLEFVGRNDQQVKIRGFRVELGEVETALLDHPDVQAVAAAVHPDPSAETNRLTAYVVPSGADTPTIGELRRFLQKKLPNYMIPTGVIPLTSLPLTPNGKIDRPTLPVPGQQRPTLPEPFAPPRTPAEEKLAEIWVTVLPTDRVGIHDNFFHLGGHSLLAVQLMARVREAFQIDAPLRSIFEAPTVADLALAIESLILQEINALTDDEAAQLL